MIQGLNDYEKFKVIRPELGYHVHDKEDLPIMHKITEDMIDINHAKPLNIKNLCSKYNNSDKIVLPFNYDKDILTYWNNPLRHIPLLQSALAVGTPDYSVYENMNLNEIRHNVYQNRWLGCLWQDYGVNAIPTIPWGAPNTFDICFGGVERGGIVIISTVGCDKNLDLFYRGFYAMQEMIAPSLIIVYGDMLPEMYGRFVNYRYTEAFNCNKQPYTQLCLFEPVRIFERKRGA